MQILSPSCVLPCQADSHSFSLSAAFHLWLEPNSLCRRGCVQTKRSRDAPKGSRHVLTELPSGEMLPKKKRRRRRNTHFCRGRGAWSVARQVAFQEKRRGKREKQQQNSWLVAGTLQLNVWWVQLGWTGAETLWAENKRRTEPWRTPSTFHRFPSAQNSSLLRGTAFRSPCQHLAISGSDD